MWLLVKTKSQAFIPLVATRIPHIFIVVAILSHVVLFSSQQWEKMVIECQKFCTATEKKRKDSIFEQNTGLVKDSIVIKFYS